MAKNVIDIILKARADVGEAKKELEGLYSFTSGKNIKNDQLLRLKEGYQEAIVAIKDYEKLLSSIDENNLGDQDAKTLVQLGKAATDTYNKFLRLWKELPTDGLISQAGKSTQTQLQNLQKELQKTWVELKKISLPELTQQQSSGNISKKALAISEETQQILTQSPESVTDFQQVSQQIEVVIGKYQKLIAEVVKYKNQRKTEDSQKKWGEVESSLTKTVDQLKKYNDSLVGSTNNLVNTQNAAEEAQQNIEQMRSSATGIGKELQSGTVALKNFQDASERSKNEVAQLVNQFARFTTLAGALNVVTNAIRSAYNAVKELDAAMNSIAVVTDMTTQDLWNQIDAYTDLATATGSTIKGSYEVAQLYYQQGLNTADVMTATEETLKMARIAQIDYASATDYATAAIKGFNLAHEDLAHINDVYSNLAAKTAADTEEISIAMSKVASIAHSTGMELETTAAFLTQIIATTREAPETAGTALKTVIARFSEVKELISTGNLTGTDEEGEEINVNKIEAALKTAGVQLRDTAGQMRDLDDVFIELASKWESLDTMQQRYIATQAAGSRQQSRFLALMNDYDGLMETVSYATDAAGASNEQFEKTLDSLESKLNALSNAWVEFTTGISDSRLIKGTVDILTAILETVNKITEAFGEVGSPIARVLLLFGSLRMAGGAIGSIGKSLGIDAITKDFGTLKGTIDQLFNSGIIGNSRAFIQLWNELDTNDARVELLQATKVFDIFSKSTAASTALTKTFQWVLAHGWAAAGIAAAILGAIKLLDFFIVTTKEAEEAYTNFTEGLQGAQSQINDLSNQYNQLNSILTDTIDILDESGEKTGESHWEELSKGVDSYGRNLSLTNEELTAYKSLVEEIVGLGLAESYEDFHKKIRENPHFFKDIQRKNQEEQQKLATEQDLEYSRLFKGRDVRKSYTKNYKNALQEYRDTDVLVTQSQGIEAPDELWSLDGLKLLSEETMEAYKQWYADLAEQIDNEGDTYTKITLMNQREHIEEAFAEYEKTSGERLIAKDKLQQSTDAARDMLANYAQTFDSFYEKNPQEQKWLLNFIEKSTKFAIDENTTQEDIEAWRDDIANILAFDWSAIDASKADGKTGEQLKDTLMTMLPDPDETAAEWMARYREVLQQIWDGMSDEMKKPYEGDFNLFAESMNIPQYDMGSISQAISNQGIESTLWERATNKGQMPITSDSQRYASWEGLIPELQSQLTVDQLEAMIGDKINIGELIAADESIDTVQKVIDAIINEYERINDTSFKKANTNFKKLSRAAQEVHDDIKDIDLSEIAKDGKLGETEKYTEEYYDLTDAFDALRESQEGNFEAAEQTIMGLNLSSEALAADMIAAEGDATAFLNLQAAKLFANMTGFNSSTGELNGDAVAAWNAGEAWKYAADCKAAYGEGDARTIAAVTYASMVTAVRGGGSSGGGGGGGGSKEPAKAEQDPFYNYIKQVEQYENALERLENQWELITDPKEAKANLEEQEDAMVKAMAANQAYLTEVGTQLTKMQGEMTDKYGKYLSFAEDGSIRLNENYFKATGKIVEEMDAWIDQYDDILGRQTDLNDELDSYKKQLKDIWEGWRDDYIDISDQLAEIYQERDEKALEDKEKYYEKLEEQDKKYLDSVRKNIEAERKARQKAKSYEDIADKQKRLALLERDTSGRYTSEVLQLREEIGQSQQDMADQEVDDMLDALERQMDEDAEQHKEILEAMQHQIDENIENRIYIERAEATIAQGDQAILNALMTSEEYLQASDAQRQKMIDEWGPQIAGMNQYIESGFATAAEYIENITEAINQLGPTMAQAISEIEVYITGSSGGGGGGSSGTSSGGNIGGSEKKWKYVLAVQKADGSMWYPEARGYDTYAKAAEAAADHIDTLWKLSKRKPVNEQYKAISVSSIFQYKKGGLVNYTGPAWVDGTPGNPEAFLNADQTRIIGEFAQHLSRLVNHSTLSFSTPTQTVSGGDCNITIEIGSLGVDYDIDKAIGKVKDEIMRATSYRGINIVKRTR